MLLRTYEGEPCILLWEFVGSLVTVTLYYSAGASGDAILAPCTRVAPQNAEGMKKVRPYERFGSGWDVASTRQELRGLAFSLTRRPTSTTTCPSSSSSPTSQTALSTNHLSRIFTAMARSNSSTSPVLSTQCRALRFRSVRRLHWLSSDFVVCHVVFDPESHASTATTGGSHHVKFREPTTNNRAWWTTNQESFVLKVTIRIKSWITASGGDVSATYQTGFFLPSLALLRSKVCLLEPHDRQFWIWPFELFFRYPTRPPTRS